MSGGLIEWAYQNVFSKDMLIVCAWIVTAVSFWWLHLALREKNRLFEIVRRNEEKCPCQTPDKEYLLVKTDDFSGFEDMPCHVDFKGMAVVSIERLVVRGNEGRVEETIIGYVDQESKEIQTWHLEVSRDQHKRLAAEFRTYLDSKSSKITA